MTDTQLELAYAVELIRRIADGELRPEHVGPYDSDLITDYWPSLFAAAAIAVPLTRPILLEVLESLAAAGAIDHRAAQLCRLALTDAAGSA